MSARESKADKEHRHKIESREQILKYVVIAISQTRGFIETIVKATAWPVSSVIIVVSMVTLAPGESTSLGLDIDFCETPVSVSVWAILGAATLVSGIRAKRERDLRISERAVNDSRMRRLEKQIDSGVTSSGTTVSGESMVGETR